MVFFRLDWSQENMFNSRIRAKSCCCRCVYIGPAYRPRNPIFGTEYSDVKTNDHDPHRQQPEEEQRRQYLNSHQNLTAVSSIFRQGPDALVPGPDHQQNQPRQQEEFSALSPVQIVARGSVKIGHFDVSRFTKSVGPFAKVRRGQGSHLPAIAAATLRV